ncbi:hypothetical protein HOY80DRAFT_945761 [Tuber brumale]|nr:hypothetical protein HOY80DRAFT_945761 [Tuber brumale]
MRIIIRIIILLNFYLLYATCTPEHALLPAAGRGRFRKALCTAHSIVLYCIVLYYHCNPAS